MVVKEGTREEVSSRGETVECASMVAAVVVCTCRVDVYLAT